MLFWEIDKKKLIYLFVELKTNLDKLETNLRHKLNSKMAAEEQQVESEFNLDELHQTLNETINDEYNEAFELFKKDILDDYQKKIIESAKSKKHNLFTVLHTWKTGYKNPDLDEEEKDLFKDYNGKKPFEIIHNYKKEQGDFYIKKELANIINSSKSSTKMYVGFKELTNKRVITTVGDQDKITKTWIIYCVIDKNSSQNSNQNSSQRNQHKNPSMKTSSNKKFNMKK